MKLGIDLGGTKIEAIVLDNQNQQVFRERVATPQGDYSATLQAMIDLVSQVRNQLGDFERLGVGIPGAVSSKTGKIKNANSVCLIGQDLKADLTQALDMHVVLANDANCFTLSEASDGAAKEYEVVFGVIIGTGCGGGIVLNGHVMNGVNAITGEWGHNPLPWASPEDEAMPCYCGLKGCLETFLSGPGMAKHFAHRTELNWTAKQISEKALLGDVQAREMLEVYAEWLAKGLASVINIVDPDAIVLGGGMSNIDYLYEKVPQLWSQWVFSDQVETVLLPPKWGDSSGVRGAAWL